MQKTNYRNKKFKNDKYSKKKKLYQTLVLSLVFVLVNSGV